VTSAVVDDVRASARYSAVSVYRGQADNDYVFSGRLDKLQEVDRNKRGKARGCNLRTNSPASKAMQQFRVMPFQNLGRCLKETLPGVVSEMNWTMDIAINTLPNCSLIPTPLASGKQ
jgi:hypothetical protein